MNHTRHVDKHDGLKIDQDLEWCNCLRAWVHHTYDCRQHPQFGEQEPSTVHRHSKYDPDDYRLRDWLQASGGAPANTYSTVRRGNTITLDDKNADSTNPSWQHNSVDRPPAHKVQITNDSFSKSQYRTALDGVDHDSLERARHAIAGVPEESSDGRRYHNNNTARSDRSDRAHHAHSGTAMSFESPAPGEGSDASGINIQAILGLQPEQLQSEWRGPRTPTTPKRSPVLFEVEPSPPNQQLRIIVPEDDHRAPSLRRASHTRIRDRSPVTPRTADTNRTPVGGPNGQLLRPTSRNQIRDNSPATPRSADEDRTPVAARTPPSLRIDTQQSLSSKTPGTGYDSSYPSATFATLAKYGVSEADLWEAERIRRERARRQAERSPVHQQYPGGSQYWH